MADLPVFLQVVIVGALISTALVIVAMVKTVRYHGWGQQKWAPPAVPWFLGSLGVIGVCFAYAAVVAIS
ncbi:hypothetical protein ACFXP7_10390 [Microbacterium sp. P06]|uniref:hypothetical protein n=1 Tax=unclassified Microbacterium TaxID=2609290 RepID=UPI003744B44A